MEYRKVLFRLGDEDGYYPGKKETEEKEEQEQAAMRPGKFHLWTPCIKHNPKTGKDEPGWAALIEGEDGVVHEIDIDHFHFENE